ncbi:carboxypeptidase-like regulatory domain-containing protein [Roseisolibacter agri]|nr:carboxypeptidase-like regulatory domain-containing protein [Roseisolibacter agri]
MTADGWDGVHLGEATAHAWLDGALPPDEAARAEAHVATCPDCTALVAEARGLIAGASRILGALDAVPAGVVPAAAPVAVPTIRPPATRRWWTGAPARAAAAVLLLAGGSAVVLRDRGVKSASTEVAQPVEMLESRAMADQVADSTALASEPMVTPAPAVAAAPEPARRMAARTRAADVAPAPPSPAAELASAPMAAPPMAPAPMPAPAAPVAVGESRRELAPSAAKSVTADAMALAGNVSGTARGLVSGRVVTPDGRPIAGAQVQIAGTTAGAVTDSIGAFRVQSPLRGAATLLTRRVGYAMDSLRVLTRGEDTSSTTIVLKPSALALEAVVTGVAGGTARPLTGRRDAVSTVAGCWVVRPERAWTAAAPALPDTLRLDRAGTASVGDERGRAAWRDGRWTAVDTATVTVTMPATGGEMTLALRRAAGDWRGTATWTATPPATRDVAPADVRLVATRCSAR